METVKFPCQEKKLITILLSALSSRVSCINSLTSPTVLLWTIHDHSHKYLYQLSSRCEQKPIGKKQHIYERKWHETKMADFNLRGVRQTRTRLSIYRAKMYAFLVPPGQRTFLKTNEHSWTKTILRRGGRRKLFNPGLMNKLVRIDWLSEWAPSDCLLSSWMLHNIHEQKGKQKYLIISLLLRKRSSEQ